MKMENYNRHKELGESLKTRRNKIKPEQVGLKNSIRRLTKGLRREEVSQLAGIGLTWYTWLEQGREINVSSDILESLSRLYMLSPEEKKHIYLLANKSLPGNLIKDYPLKETLINILDKLDLSYCPSYIIDYHWNIIAWNNCAKAVFCDFNEIDIKERNIVYMMFCNKKYMSLFDNWEYHAKGIIARFHSTIAKSIDDIWVKEFINNLKNRSTNFSHWWSLHDVHSMSDVTKELTHLDFGKLSFEFLSFDVSDNNNLKLLTHNPDNNTLIKLKNYLS